MSAARNRISVADRRTAVSTAGRWRAARPAGVHARAAVAAVGAAICVAAAAAESAGTVDPDAFPQQRRVNSMALHSKLLCSGVFVSGRPPERVIAEDLQWREYTFHDWRTTRWSVDREAGTVQLAGPVPGRADEVTVTSAWHEGHGCTLLPTGAERVAFVPRDFRGPAGDGRATREAPLATGAARDPDRMKHAMNYAFDQGRGTPQNTRALVVVHEGRIVAERYAAGFDAAMPLIGWSMGKSIAAALVGIAARETGLNVDAPAPVPQWQAEPDPRSGITTLDLLQMSSGLQFRNPSFGDSLYYTDLHEHESVYFRGQNTARLATGARLRYRPGTVYQYRNGNTLSLMSMLRDMNSEADVDHLLWPHENLFDRIGATSFVLEPDAWGNMIITGFVYATARDWARLGLFFLRDGRPAEKAQSLWPEGWLDVITTPAATNAGYGGQVWLNTNATMPDVPRDAFFFRGWLGQLVIVVPGRELVIVRLGFSADGDYLEFANRLVAEIERAL